MTMNLGCGVMDSTDAGKHLDVAYNNASENMRLYTASKDHLNAQKHTQNNRLLSSLLVHDGSKLLVHLLQKVLVLHCMLA